MVTVMQLAFIAVGYAVSSSCLVIINKWAVDFWPYSSSLTFVQLTASWIAAFLLGKVGIFEVDPLNWAKVKAFSPACLIFFVVLACNMKLLQHANVDTFIVLRSLVPLATVFAERIYLGTPIPDGKVLATLVLIVVGSVGYVKTDNDFSLTAYSWGAAYVISMVVDTVLVKKVVTNVELTSWGLVYYNNIIASSLYPIFSAMTGEITQIPQALFALSDGSSDAPVAVFASCIFGLSISYFGLNARKTLQATAFSVLGVVCKFATVLVNTIVWDKHASPIGIFWLCVCIVGGILYQQAMKMKAITQPTAQAKPDASDNKGAYASAPIDEPEEAEV